MSLPLQIAQRYLKAKKSHHAINLISWISMCGISVACTALICTLSVFNGFQDLFSTLFCSFDPQLKIVPTTGKVFNPNDSIFTQIQSMDEIAIYTEILEENALLKYKDRQVPATIKGVSNNFQQLTQIDSLMKAGSFMLKDQINQYGVLGVGLVNVLGTGGSLLHPITVYAPRRIGKININNPQSSFRQSDIFLSGIFAVEQPEYDEKFLITSIQFARDLFQYKNEVSAIELSLKKGSNEKTTQSKIQQLVGSNYLVKNRYQQQEEFFKMMNIEKWMSYLILGFILLIATFNIIGSISMLIYDKKEDIKTLSHMGADQQFIVRIFLYEGRMIILFGAILGIILGLLLSFIQQKYGLLQLGNSPLFLIQAYPVKIIWTDILVVLSTVLICGFLAVWYPVSYLVKSNFIEKR